MFCKCEDHYSDQCRIITDIDTRREILKKRNICFKCLKPGHIKKNCRNKIKYFRCKAEGNHHTALCYPKNYSQHTSPTTTNSDQNSSSITPPVNEQTATCLVKSDTTTMLQTASACVMNKREDQFCVVNVLFDTGSQQTFISDMEDQLGVGAVKYKLAVGAAESGRDPGSETGGQETHIPT